VDAQYLDGRKPFVIPQFLTAEECRAFIERSEQLGYADAPINNSFGPVLRKDVRDNQRLLLDDPDRAAAWSDRAKGLLVEEWFGWEAVGLNERFRFYRHDPGQRFARHLDGCFRRDNGEQSHFTFMVYLNGGFEGGATAFHEGRPSLLVTPERGKALVFYHRQVHEGMAVVRGRKYVLRTDVMDRHQGRAGHGLLCARPSPTWPISSGHSWRRPVPGLRSGPARPSGVQHEVRLR
jgi:hypothetical protein